ncbi:5-formyltetrahydrofolate cyclo-ligase [uncultured Limosilactobacillus sp.]|uniref:5-formyltetrahydrofolate cyclo-ligase n=1 Tax=uncultured Limosilactobacillus sp. TaxID=2837629 RepID=UPI0025DF31FD|nr:5-formyltetrahydrofolate cyclo-ligase [uncultured Limosilactobacillus sp.]
MYSKKEMRQAYIARLQQLDLNTRLEEEGRLTAKLYDQLEWFKANTIAITLSQSFEINTAPIILHARHKGQRVVVPRTLPHRQMEFVTLTEETEFNESYFGVLEPVNGQVVHPNEIDLMIVPGVAFTLAGKRLGFGGGYYDRYLANYQGPKFSLALNTQLAADDEWSDDEFDISMDKVINLVSDAQ